MHEAVYMAKEVNVRYTAHYFGFGMSDVIRNDEIIKWVTIHECQVNGDIHKKEDNLYFDKLKKNFIQVYDVVRAPDGKYVYLMDYNIEEHIDDETENSEKKARERIALAYEKERRDPGTITPYEPFSKKKWWEFDLGR